MAKNETYMSSREWLDKHGLKAKNLGFYDVLSGVAFKHQDGVVDIRRAPQDNILQTDAVCIPALRSWNFQVQDLMMILSSPCIQFSGEYAKAGQCQILCKFSACAVERRHCGARPSDSRDTQKL